MKATYEHIHTATNERLDYKFDAKITQKLRKNYAKITQKQFVKYYKSIK